MKSLDLTFACGPCFLGRMLLAQTPHGICALFLGDEASALVRQLRQRFACARLHEDGARLAPLLAQLAAWLERPQAACPAALDLHGTPWQQRVWQRLRAIPAGQTCHYEAIAQGLGVARGARAVAGACAANPVAVAVPCHRVLRKDGGAGGYRWGLQRKLALLQKERG